MGKKKKRNIKQNVLGLALILMIAFSCESFACTSFMLKTDQGLYFVHSLNQGNVKSVPVLIFINRRNTWKKGYSWEALIQVNNETDPSLVWKSKFGSVTFNPLGRELPDGGMNEAGLFIWEMGFDTKYPTDKNKPKLFQMQWMQYQLDNFGTMEEVIENAGQMALDGWGWHYFVADKSGKSAIIDFVDGKPVVYSGDNMPVPICCNSVYADAMKWLKQHKGFGGDLEIVKKYQEIPRFICGAKLMQEYTSQDPVEYSFYMLDQMSKNVRWSVIIDIKNMKVFYKTNLNQDIRYFALSHEDFGGKDTLMLDIEHPGPKNIRSQFIPYNQEMDKKLIKSFFELVCKEYPSFRKVLLDDQGVDIDGLTQGFMKEVKFSDNSTNYNIQGEWVGNVKYPSPGGWTELPMTLVLQEENENLTGTVNDNQVIKNVPMTNIIYKGGLLYFTIKTPDTGDILYYQLYVSTNKMKGPIEFWNKKKKASVNLNRKSLLGNLRLRFKTSKRGRWVRKSIGILFVAQIFACPRFPAI